MQIIHQHFIFRDQAFGQNTLPNVIILGSSILCIASFTITAVLLLFFPYGVNYGEAPILDQALKLTAGQDIYKNSLQTPPYTISNYTPLYPLLLAGFLRLTHLPLFLSGRALSIFATLISSLVIGAMTRRLFNSPIAGFLASAFFLGHPYVGLWSSLVRVDAMALAFNLVGLWITYTHWHSYKWLALGILCFLAAIFTRQTYLLTALLTSTVWLFHKDMKRGFIFLSTLSLLVLTVFLSINAYTHGGFYSHIIIANINNYGIKRILSMGTLFLITSPLLLPCSATIIRKEIKRPTDPFFTWGLLPYTLGAFLTAITVGKTGSDINYFMELISASAILAAGVWVNKPGKLISILLVINTFWAIALNGLLFQTPMVRSWKNLSDLDSLFQKVQDASSKGPVLADDRLDMVVLAGQAIYYQPFEYTQLYNAGLWDTTEFAKEIASQKFSLILISGNTINKSSRWSTSITQIIEKYYEITQKQDLLIYTPVQK